MAKFFANLLVLLIFFPPAFAQRKEPHKSIQISVGYFSGQYLIYDCKKGFFACVDEDGFEDCRGSREFSIKILEAILPCAPLRKYPHYDDCWAAQKEEIESPKKKEFCFLKRDKSR